MRPDHLHLTRPTGALLYMGGGSYVRRCRAVMEVIKRPGARLVDAVVAANAQGLKFGITFTSTKRPRAA
jgi:hypothetical protein